MVEIGLAAETAQRAQAADEARAHLIKMINLMAKLEELSDEQVEHALRQGG